MSPGQVDVMRLGLIGNAARAAAIIAKAHPDVHFRSGRRTLEEQASAMSKNVVRAGRKWIAENYKASNVVAAVQRWIDSHPEAVTYMAIRTGMLVVLRQFSDLELRKLSKHLTGQAFDIEPIDGLQGQMALQTIRSVVKELGGTFLENEGKVKVWHCQF